MRSGLSLPLWKLRVGLYLFSFAGAFATNLSKIGAQAYLLHRFPPQYLIFHLILAGLLLWVVSRCTSRFRWAFSIGSVLFCALAALIFTDMRSLESQNFILDNLMVFFTLFFSEYFYWVLVETVNRYVHPIRAPQILAGTFSGFEIGTIAALSMVFIFPQSMTVSVQFQISSIAALLLAIGFILWFLHPAIRPVRFNHSEVQESIPQFLSPGIRKMILCLFLLGALAGGAKILSEFIAAFIVRNSGTELASLSRKLSMIYLVGSALTLTAHFSAILVEKKKHESPGFWMSLGTLVSGTGILAAFFVNPLAGAFLVGSLFRGTYKGLFGLGLETYLVAFSEPIRQRMKQAFNLAFYLMRAMVMLIPLVLFWAPAQYHLMTLLSWELLLILGMGLALPRLSRAWSYLVWKFLLHGDKTSQILAASQFIRIGFRNPVRVFGYLLSKKPKTVLQKTLIESLGYEPKLDRYSASKILIQQFHNTDKEEVHIAILNTLFRIETPWNIRFFQEIVLGRDRTIRVRVRQEALTKLYSLYGDRASAFCLDGLHDEDPRVVAESLLNLGSFRHDGMTPVFEQHAQDEDPYIRSAAFYALACRASSKNRGLDGLRAMLTSQNSLELYLALEKILRLKKLSSFLPACREISETRAGHIAKIGLLLGSVFIRARKNDGYKLFADMLFRLSKNQRSMVGFHYFSMLEPEDRIEVIVQIHQLCCEENGELAQFDRWLKNSGYDFHWEIDALHYLSEPKSLLKKFKLASSKLQPASHVSH